MANYNGLHILKALQTFDGPATGNEIVKYIAATVGSTPKTVKEPVLETLNGGVRYGFVQQSRHKYFMAPVKLEELAGEEGQRKTPSKVAEKNSKPERRAELKYRNSRFGQSRASQSSHIQRSTSPVEECSDAESEMGENDSLNEGELEDRAGRKRRGRRGGSRRSRSRSRRRRISRRRPSRK